MLYLAVLVDNFQTKFRPVDEVKQI